ncbi:protein SODIUM POTASSIUM ROOT DEFECTIVE 3 isoform X2 [Malania oleifera]|uniref:protein SODIUM POTASSIUM ROOT DEFECTIVE 3 isoform X2 n=1 Tax=Malania oleifera TaxID=397392 RepID=UPI0025ADDF1E|nr:protein SODIUM POTASSIUM ROOT DEFECTIVE 3 isoform X2 [Malania oleifera]
MKGIDIFCASQASTAIYVSTEQGSSSSAASRFGGPAIDRYNPIIRDERRSGGRALAAPCSSSQSPINPKPLHHRHQQHHHHQKKTRKCSAAKKNYAKQSDRPNSRSKSCSKLPSDLIRKRFGASAHLSSPLGSSRNLLSDEPFCNVLSDFDQVLTLVPVEPKKSQPILKQDEAPASASASASEPSSSSSSRPSDQVVVLRVSLHCKGCEGKVRKHISRMEGVTSFNIDFAAKKVTVIGDVTPMSVLASISKVKNARLLTSAVPSTSPSSSFET